MKRTMILPACLAIGWLFFVLPSALCAQETDTGEAVNIGSNRELLVDSYLIGSLDGTAQKLWPPRDEGPVLFLDRPWEGEFCLYMTVIHVDSKYRLYYRGGPTPGKGDGTDDRTCY
ncbi:MAG: hypothetical protein IJG25_05900, partial [Thermoguttaceae bacterium]|nr:hypothetical protein [Thermoguttaceae bacterium]